MFNSFKSFKSNTEGVAAIEFAIFAIPFLVLIMGIVEIGAMFGAATILSGATEDAARMIRTGQVKNPDGEIYADLDCSGSEDCFTALLEQKLFRLIDTDDLTYHVIKLTGAQNFETAYADPNVLPEIVDTADPTQLTAKQFDAGDPNSKMIVRVSYDYQFLTPLPALLTRLSGSEHSGLGNRPGNKRLLVSTAIIQNEPYD